MDEFSDNRFCTFTNYCCCWGRDLEARPFDTFVLDICALDTLELDALELDLLDQIIPLT